MIRQHHHHHPPLRLLWVVFVLIPLIQLLSCSAYSLKPSNSNGSTSRSHTITSSSTLQKKRKGGSELWTLPSNNNIQDHGNTEPRIRAIMEDDRSTAAIHHDGVHNPQTLIVWMVMTLLVMSAIPTAAWAVDHPVDFGHLDIPNLPIPNADPRYFISGGICAAASHGVTTPLDVVKTRIQSEPETFNQGIVSAATSIVQQDGPQSLLNGLVPTVVGYGFEGALKFGLYESLKPTFNQLLALDDPTEGYLFASVAAGAVASIVLCPMEQTRIRLVTDPDFADGFVSGVVRLTDEEGIGAIFYGLPAMLSKQVPYTMAKQVSFDIFAALLYGVALQYSLVAADVRTEVEFFAAFLASILACVASHPGDVVLTATYKGGSNGGFLTVVNNLYDQKGGFNAFFSGITARFFHVGAIITSQLVLYDIIKQMLGLPATGTH